jgi:ribonuclease PH
VADEIVFLWQFFASALHRAEAEHIMPYSMATTTLSSLHRADGSVTYSDNGFMVIAAVNGPIEVQRRDELPEEAAIDVAVRPASGLGSE